MRFGSYPELSEPKLRIHTNIATLLERFKIRVNAYKHYGLTQFVQAMAALPKLLFH